MCDINENVVTEEVVEEVVEAAAPAEEQTQEGGTRHVNA